MSKLEPAIANRGCCSCLHIHVILSEEEYIASLWRLLKMAHTPITADGVSGMKNKVFGFRRDLLFAGRVFNSCPLCSPQSLSCTDGSSDSIPTLLSFSLAIAFQYSWLASSSSQRSVATDFFSSVEGFLFASPLTGSFSPGLVLVGSARRSK